MINIEKGSFWYRLALYGVFFEEHKIKDNLCPFMRQALWGLVLICCYAFVSAIFIIGTLTPILQLVMVIIHGSHYWEINGAMVGGMVIWVIIGIILLCYFFAETKAGVAIRNQTSTQYNKVMSKEWVVIQMLKAYHDKMCPKLAFNGH